MVTCGKLRPLDVWADFCLHCLCLADEDLLFTVPMISVSSIKKRNKAKNRVVKSSLHSFMLTTKKETGLGVKQNSPTDFRSVEELGERGSSGEHPTTPVLLLPSGQVCVLCPPELLLPARMLALGAWGGKPSLCEHLLQENRS